jgi:hypothetical protein
MHNSTQSFSLLFTICLSSFSPHALGAAVNCDPDPGRDMLIEYGDSVACVFEGASDVDVFRFWATPAIGPSSSSTVRPPASCSMILSAH